MRIPSLVTTLLGVAACSTLAVGQTPAFSNQGVAAGLQYGYSTGGYSNSQYAGGGSAGDFDNDGWTDVHGCGGGSSSSADRLFINQQDGTFVDEAASWGTDITHKSKASSVADFNDDGWLDIYITSAGPPGGGSGQAGNHVLWKNLGNGTMANVAGTAGVNFTTSGTLGDGWGSAWGDYDRDGDLDLFVAGFKNNNLGSRLFQNNGDETFTDVTNAIDFWGSTPISVKAFAPVFADFDGDRYPELALAADFGTMRYFRNNTDGTFTDVSVAAGITEAENGMGGHVKDWNADGKRDWYVTSIYWPAINWTGNKLHVNTSTGPGDHSFSEISGAAGVADGGYGWGTVGVDFNHDGLLDIAETNGDSSSSGQFANEQSYLWIKDSTGLGFTEMAIGSGLQHFQKGRGMINFDADNDGDQDLMIWANNQNVTYWRNDLITGSDPGADRNWLRVFLDTSADPALPPNGYHSEVWVTTGSDVQMRNVDGGDNFLSMSELSAHFGLGTATNIDELKVVWADGSETILEDVAVNQHLTIAAEGESPWEDLGGGLAGTFGIPSNAAEGPLVAGEDVTITLSNALGGSTAYLVVGAFEINAPFKGGTLVPDPNPPGFFVPLPTLSGTVAVTDTWPAGIPSGFNVWVQWWVVDAAGPVGFASTNTQKGTTP